MEAEYGQGLRGRDDPLYEEGLAHVQAGNFAAARRCFDELAARYPNDVEVARAQRDAEWKERMDRETRVRERSALSRIPWRRIFFYLLVLVAIGGAIYLAVTFIQQRVAPQLAVERERQAFEALLQGCRDAAQGEFPAEARTACDKVLQKDPNNAEVKGILLIVEDKEKEQKLCQEARDAFAAGRYQEALEKFTDIQVLYPGKCGAAESIATLQLRQTVEGAFKACGEAADAGDYATVVEKCEEVRSRNGTYEEQAVSDRLYTAYFALGMQLLDQKPPRVEDLPLALDYVTRALQIRPKDADAQREQKLASQYLAAQQAFEGGRLDDAMTSWSAVVDARPDYLGGRAAEQLYGVYLNRGDQYRDAGDVSMAYRMYDLAANVPGVDHASAINRRDSVVGSLTPTPTPTATFTPSPTPTATPVPPPTAVRPTPIPAPPRPGQILYRSNKSGSDEYWVVNPDGSGRRSVGSDERWEKLHKSLREREAYSPDGRFRAYALQANGDSSVQIYWQGVNSDGFTITTRITDFGKISYDPVWSPDGGRIAFVSTAGESDDIWVANSDGKGDPKNLTANPWQWDKHPSWSPDSKRLVFWSNRETKRRLLWVMDADGGNAKCISENCRPAKVDEKLWEEWDPVWVK